MTFLFSLIERTDPMVNLRSAGLSSGFSFSSTGLFFGSSTGRILAVDFMQKLIFAPPSSAETRNKHILQIH
jgi:hypothetical protein